MVNMKVVILAGGLGTRLSEETHIKPKPMVEIGGRPILWHIMKLYSYYGFNDFIIALGYKGEVVKDYFLNYFSRSSDLAINLSNNAVSWSKSDSEDWNVQLVDTGKDSLTGGRLHRLEPLLRDSGAFMLTYGDGVSNVNIGDLLSFHKRSRATVTVTAVRPPARFGAMGFDGDLVVDFREKPQLGEGWINGGFFVMEPDVFKYLDGDATILERSPLERLAKDRKLMGYRHDGFWYAMDTVRDRDYLNEEWNNDRAPWKIWEKHK